VWSTVNRGDDDSTAAADPLDANPAAATMRTTAKHRFLEIIMRAGS
jgi:hypothetical protein